MYSGLCSGKVEVPRQISAINALFSNARSSLSSAPGRRSSVNSVLSSAERASSRKGSSDGSLGSADKLNSRKELNLNNSYLAREMTFSPIHEHNEEAAGSESQEDSFV